MPWIHWRVFRASAWSGWAAAMSCDIRWWRASWMRMISERRRKATSDARRVVVARARRPASKAMDPGASRSPAQAGIRDEVSVIVAEPAWRRLVRRADTVAAQAARAAGARGTVVLA